MRGDEKDGGGGKEGLFAAQEMEAYSPYWLPASRNEKHSGRFWLAKCGLKQRWRVYFERISEGFRNVPYKDTINRYPVFHLTPPPQLLTSNFGVLEVFESRKLYFKF